MTESENRIAILNLIRSRQGIHKSEIQRETGVAWGTVTYHLNLLESAGVVRAHCVGSRRYYNSARSRDLPTSTLLPETQRILAALEENGIMSPVQLARALDVSAKVVRSHTTALLDDGLIVTDGAYHPRFWLADHAMTTDRFPPTLTTTHRP